MELRIVVYREGPAWIAQCLEHDIAAQAQTAHDLRERFDRTLVREADYTRRIHGEAFAGIGPAPQRFFDLFESCGAPAEDWDAPEELGGADIKMALCAA